MKSPHLELVESLKNIIKSTKTTISVIKANRAKYNKVMRVGKKLHGKGHINYLYHYPSHDCLHAAISVHGLEGFSDYRLVQTLLAYEKVGVEFNKSSAYPDGSYTSYSGVSADKTIHVDLTAHLKDDAQNCKRVLVEVKTIQQPVYKFECQPELVVQAIAARKKTLSQE